MSGSVVVKEKMKERWRCQQRLVLAFMILWTGIILVMLSSNINVAIVCMVETQNHRESIHEQHYNNQIYYNVSTYINDYNGHVVSIENSTLNGSNQVVTVDPVCQETDNVKSTLYTENAKFSWNKKTQSIVLSSFYYGSILMQIPGGWLAVRFGGKRVIGTCMLLSSVLTLLMPIFARASVYLIVATRAILGLLLATISPSVCELVGTWALPGERSRMMGMLVFGQMTGVVIGYSTSGLLCVHGFDNGWPSIFYIHGMFGCLLVGFWWTLVYSSPQSHPRISMTEKRLLLQHLNLRPKHQRKTETIPWRSIFTYVPIYVVFIAHICEGCIYFLLLTCLPLFLREVMKFDITSNGVFACLPYISFMFGIAVSGTSADFIRSLQRLSTTTIRKAFQVTSFLGIAIFIVLPAFLTCEQRYLVIGCLCLCTFFEALGISAGLFPNMVDIAPRYSSLIFGVSNTIATIPGIVTPIVVAQITQSGSSEAWNLVFLIASGISVMAAFVYGCFADSELAPWALEDKYVTDLEIEITTTLELMENNLSEVVI